MMVKKIFNNIQVILTWIIAIGLLVLIVLPYFLLKNYLPGNKKKVIVTPEDIIIEKIETPIDDRQKKSFKQRQKAIDMAKGWLKKIEEISKRKT